MLLRRFMQHLKEQNWFAVGLDVVVVIVGIFLGIQVADWNELRKEYEDEREYIQRLHDDLILAQNAAARVLKRRIDTFEDFQSGVRVLLESDGQLTQAQCDGIGNSDILNIVITDLPSLVELQSSGRLGIIRDPELRRSAVVLQQHMVSLQEMIVFMTSENYPLYHLFPELVTVSSVFNEEMNEFNLGTDCDLESMRADVKFMNTVSINLDVYDAYMRDGVRPWMTELERLLGLTEEYLGISSTKKMTKE